MGDIIFTGSDLNIMLSLNGTHISLDELLNAIEQAGQMGDIPAQLQEALKNDILPLLEALLKAIEDNEQLETLFKERTEEIQKTIEENAELLETAINDNGELIETAITNALTENRELFQEAMEEKYELMQEAIEIQTMWLEAQHGNFEFISALMVTMIVFFVGKALYNFFSGLFG